MHIVFHRATKPLAFSDAVASRPQVTSLTYLDLSCTGLPAGAALQHLTRLTSLRQLDLGWTEIESDDLAKLSPLSSTLQRLCLKASGGTECDSAVFCA